MLRLRNRTSGLLNSVPEAVVMVVGALAYLAASGDLTGDMVIATVLGVFVSVLLGSGLMAAAYFSDKSGHDRDVNDAARDRDPNG